MKLYGYITANRTIKPKYKKLWLTVLNKLKEKEVEIDIKKVFRKRTCQQNRFYWLNINLITEQVNDLGNDYLPEDIHELHKWRFLRKSITIKGNTYQSMGSTTKMNKQEFGEFLDKIQLFWNEMGIETIDYEQWKVENGIE